MNMTKLQFFYCSGTMGIYIHAETSGPAHVVYARNFSCSLQRRSDKKLSGPVTPPPLVENGPKPKKRWSGKSIIMY